MMHYGRLHYFVPLVFTPEEMWGPTGDRESEVRYLAERVGITEVRAGQTPEQGLAIIREETRRANTVSLGTESTTPQR